MKKRHGKGKEVWPDGRKYEGDYVNGVQEGYGVYCYADDSKYEGDWKNKKRHGKGKEV